VRVLVARSAADRVVEHSGVRVDENERSHGPEGGLPMLNFDASYAK